MGKKRSACKSNNVYYGTKLVTTAELLILWHQLRDMKTFQIAISFQLALFRLDRTKFRRDKPLSIAQAVPPALKIACKIIFRRQFSTYGQVEISL